MFRVKKNSTEGLIRNSSHSTPVLKDSYFHCSGLLGSSLAPHTPGGASAGGQLSPREVTPPINNNTRTGSCVLHSHSCQPTFARPACLPLNLVVLDRFPGLTAPVQLPRPMRPLLRQLPQNLPSFSLCVSSPPSLRTAAGKDSSPCVCDPDPLSLGPLFLLAWLGLS